MTSIKLSPKHGVNPMIPRCFYCGKNKNEVLLLGRLSGDKEAPRNAVMDYQPCDECANYMAQGIILIEVRNDEPTSLSPYRMSGWAVIREDAVLRIFSEATAQNLLKRRMGFLETRVWDAIGIPREEFNNLGTEHTTGAV